MMGTDEVAWRGECCDDIRVLWGAVLVSWVFRVRFWRLGLACGVGKRGFNHLWRFAADWMAVMILCTISSSLLNLRSQ